MDELRQKSIRPVTSFTRRFSLYPRRSGRTARQSYAQRKSHYTAIQARRSIVLALVGRGCDRSSWEALPRRPLYTTFPRTEFMGQLEDSDEAKSETAVEWECIGEDER